VITRLAIPVHEPFPNLLSNELLPTTIVVAFANTFAPTATTVVLPTNRPVLKAIAVTLAVDVLFAT
jgi:hypothetical protein